MLDIVFKEIKEFLRDRTNLFFFLMFPALLVFLLGNLLASQDNADAIIGDISVRYIVETKDPQSIAAIEGFVAALQDEKTMKIEKSDDLAAAQQAVVSHEITALVVFREPMAIQIYEGNNAVQNRTVAAVMNGFARTGKAVTAAAVISPESLAQGVTVDGNYVSTKDLGVNRTILDYYAVSMLTLITFVSLLSGGYAFTRERDGKTINRLIISPRNRWVLYIQKIVGTIPQLVVQTLVLMLVSVFGFDAHYAATWQGNIFLFGMFFSVAFALISIGALIGLFLKTDPTVTLMPILWLVMFFGGTFSRMMRIEELTPYLPNYFVQQAAFDVTLFGRYGLGLQVITASGLLFAASLVTGVIVFNRKEEER